MQERFATQLHPLSPQKNCLHFPTYSFRWRSINSDLPRHQRGITQHPDLCSNLIFLLKNSWTLYATATISDNRSSKVTFIITLNNSKMFRASTETWNGKRGWSFRKVRSKRVQNSYTSVDRSRSVYWSVHLLPFIQRMIIRTGTRILDVNVSLHLWCKKQTNKKA